MGGNTAVDPTPQFFGTCQDASLEIDQKLEEIRGASQFPDDVGPTDRKVSMKVGFGKIELSTLNQLYFGDTSGTGVTAISALENHTVAATVTIAPPETGTYAEDLGVIFGSAGGLGLPFTKLPSGTPATGQYTVNVSTGVYTFATADIGKAVQISYNYTLTGGTTQQVNNQVLGWGPYFEMWMQFSYVLDISGYPTSGLWLAKCRAGKLSSPLKRAGYLIQTLDVEAYANSTGQVMLWFQGPSVT